MIDHITVLVSDYDRSKAFFQAALEPLGYAVVMEMSREQVPQLPVDRTCGLGVGGKPDLWLRPTSQTSFSSRSTTAPARSSAP